VTLRTSHTIDGYTLCPCLFCLLFAIIAGFNCVFEFWKTTRHLGPACSAQVDATSRPNGRSPHLSFYYVLKETRCSSLEFSDNLYSASPPRPPLDDASRRCGPPAARWMMRHLVEWFQKRRASLDPYNPPHVPTGANIESSEDTHEVAHDINR
jgi:hypothetical protein